MATVPEFHSQSNRHSKRLPPSSSADALSAGSISAQEMIREACVGSLQNNERPALLAVNLKLALAISSIPPYGKSPDQVSSLIGLDSTSSPAPQT
jgi:hypothetical protein